MSLSDSIVSVYQKKKCLLFRKICGFESLAGKSQESLGAGSLLAAVSLNFPSIFIYISYQDYKSVLDLCFAHSGL